MSKPQPRETKQKGEKGFKTLEDAPHSVRARHGRLVRVGAHHGACPTLPSYSTSISAFFSTHTVNMTIILFFSTTSRSVIVSNLCMSALAYYFEVTVVAMYLASMQYHTRLVNHWHQCVLHQKCQTTFLPLSPQQAVRRYLWCCKVVSLMT